MLAADRYMKQIERNDRIAFRTSERSFCAKLVFSGGASFMHITLLDIFICSA